MSRTVEELYNGPEPTFGDSGELSLIRSLSWYSNQYGAKESKKYTIDYVKKLKLPKEIFDKVSEADEELFKNLGFVCRMVLRGADLNREKWISSRIAEIIKSEVSVSQFSVTKPDKTIQDRIYDQSSEYISSLEDIVDAFIKTRESPEFNPYNWMISSLMKPVHARQIIDHFNPMLTEIVSVMNKEDEQLVEAYSSYKKSDLRTFYNLVNSIIEDSKKIVSNAKVIKKPRKTKTIAADKKIVSLKYKKEDIEYKIKSINPVAIIGAKQLWIFNTKYKKLGVYNAKDESGFSVKGTTLGGFDETSSIAKTLRKPLDVLPVVLNAKKVEIRKLMKEIKATESLLTGRINDDIILLKVL